MLTELIATVLQERKKKQICNSVRNKKKHTINQTLQNSTQKQILRKMILPHLKNKHGKILHICNCIKRIGCTPKKFLYILLPQEQEYCCCNPPRLLGFCNGMDLNQTSFGLDLTAHTKNRGWKSSLESIHPEGGMFFISVSRIYKQTCYVFMSFFPDFLGSNLCER
jgi:hypothetical protein